MQEIKISSSHNANHATFYLITAKKIVISANFLVWKFCGKVQFRSKLCGNCAFSQNFHTMKLGEITVFFAVYLNEERWKIERISFKVSQIFLKRKNVLTLKKHWTFAFLSIATKLTRWSKVIQNLAKHLRWSVLWK